MAEKESLGKKSINYDGIFQVKEILSLIRDTASDKGFSSAEVDHVESVKKDGRYVKRSIVMGKKISDYAKLQINAKLQFSSLKDTVVKKNGKKKYQTGMLYMTIEPIIVTDYEDRWESRPAFFLIRMFFEKFIHPLHLSKFKKEGVDLMDLIYDNVKSYLNLQKY